MPRKRCVTFPDIPPDVLNKILAYYKIRNIHFFFVEFYQICVILLFLFKGRAGTLEQFARRRSKNIFFQYALCIFIFSAYLFIATLPLWLYRGFFVEHQFGLSNETFSDWLWRELKTFFVNTLLSIPVIFIGYVLMRKLRKSWWWGGALCSVLVLMMSLIIIPVFVDPLFNTFTPVKNKTLARNIYTLAEKSGIENSKIFEADISRQTKKVNAYVTGLFNTKRIVLWDTLLKWKEDEILFVMGHEMGHYKLKHLWIFVFCYPVVILLGLFIAYHFLPSLIARYKARWGIQNIYDAASYPLFVLFFSVYFFLTMPLVNTANRYFEAQADKFGLQVTKNPDAAVRVFTKFAIQNLTHPDPHPILSFWRDSHPTLKNRIKMAREFSQKNSVK